MDEWENIYMKDTDWEILYELYQTKNITMVANKLFLSQPSMTKRIQNIEEDFGVKIVTRNTRGVIFTKEGELLAEKAAEYLQFTKGIRKELEAMQEAQETVLHVGSSYTYSKYVLTDILNDFSKEYPECRVDVVNEQSNLLYHKVCTGELDIALVRGDYENPELGKIKLDTNKGYILSKDAIDERTLPSLTRIEYKMNDRTRELIDSWWKEYFKEEASVGINAGYVDVAWQLVEKGMGYCCCFLSEQFNNSMNLKLTPMLHTDGSSLERNTWCIYQNKKVTKEMKLFLEFVKCR